MPSAAANSLPEPAAIPHIAPPMPAIWRSLAWKEWHEHKWKLVSITVISWSVAAMMSGYDFTADWMQLATSVVTLCVLPLSIFVGLAAAANERSRGTMPFLQALPIPMWRVAICKLLLGAITFTTPIAVAALLSYLWYSAAHSPGGTPSVSNGITGSDLGDFVLSAALCAISLFIWTAATSVNSRDEVRAGARSLVIMVGWSLILLLVGSGLYTAIGGENSWLSFKSIAAMLSSIAPGGVIRSVPAAPDRLILYICVAITITVHATLAAWYIVRFGRIGNAEVRSPQTVLQQITRPGWLAPPRKSPLAAIVWKQWRESGPLVLAGFAGVVCIATAVCLGDPEYFFTRRPDALATMIAATIVSIGYCVALVVGIGVCYSDIAPSLNTFWRSRPINPHTWFWGKYCTGLIVLLTSLYIPLFIVIYFIHPQPKSVFLDDLAVLMPAAHLAIFAAAVATTCLARHAIYAAILTIPFVYLGVAIVWTAIRLAALSRGIHHVPANLLEMSHLQQAAGFLLTFAICTPLAWLAMQNDWGRKSRY